MENGTRLLAETLMELGNINNDLQSRANGVEWELERAKEELELERSQFKKYRAGSDVQIKDLTSQLTSRAELIEMQSKRIMQHTSDKIEFNNELKVKDARITILEVGITNAMKSIVDRKVLRKLKELLK